MAAASSFVFARPAVASQVAQWALGEDPFSPGEVSVFLAAPRRTGKSTFLVHDLLPELTSRGAVPVYVDLWSQRSGDPGALIVEAVRKALDKQGKGVLSRIRGAGVTKAGLGSWLSFDLDKLGVPGGATLAEGLAALIRKSGSPVVVVVDEAQQALKSEAGRDAMFALKSARDTINLDPALTGGRPAALGLVFTGSHRDKLASLVTGRDQPFFGSRIRDFPLLGRDYTEAYGRHINGLLPPDRRIDPAEIEEAFDVVGRRPQYLHAAVTRYATGDLGGERGFDTLLRLAEDERETHWDSYRRQWSSLDALQQAVLRRIISEGAGFRPFDADSLAAYAADVGVGVAAKDVQRALDNLREQELVVRLERGRYSLEDPSLADWLRAEAAPKEDEEAPPGPRP